MASLEERGIGACSGRESLWEMEKKNSEKLKLSHIGTENQCLLTNPDSNIEDKQNAHDMFDIKTINTSTNLKKCW